METISPATQDDIREDKITTLFPIKKEDFINPDLSPGYYKVNGKKVPTPVTLRTAIRDLLLLIGEDPAREGLVDTPGRVVKALEEMTTGYSDDPKVILSKVFKAENYDEMVIVRNISFTSLCEHHLLTFTGIVDIGYLPCERKGIVGLSKLARLVDCFSKRLQVQERMTRQIAEAIVTHLDAEGVGVVVTAQHSCMGCRGVRKPEADMITSAMYRLFRTSSSARAEFLSLIKG